jgi:hypothetical protein
MVPGVNSIRAVAIAERALMKSMADLPLVEIQGRKVLIEAVSEKISTGWL